MRDRRLDRGASAAGVLLIAFGFISYAFLKLVTGRAREAHWLVHLSAALFVRESFALVPAILPSLFIGVPIGAWLIRRIDPERLENILTAFFRPNGKTHKPNLFERLLPRLFSRKEKK